MHIAGLDRAAVFAALYNASKPQGMGFLHYDPKPMSYAEAKLYLEQYGPYFDYVNGRVMKIDLGKSDELDTYLYNRDNGPHASEDAINAMRMEGTVNPPVIQAHHKIATAAEVTRVESKLDEKTTSTNEGGVDTIKLGLADVKEHLAPAVEKAKKSLKK